MSVEARLNRLERAVRNHPRTTSVVLAVILGALLDDPFDVALVLVGFTIGMLHTDEDA